MHWGFCLNSCAPQSTGIFLVASRDAGTYSFLIITYAKSLPVRRGLLGFQFVPDVNDWAIVRPHPPTLLYNVYIVNKTFPLLCSVCVCVCTQSDSIDKYRKSNWGILVYDCNSLTVIVYTQYTYSSLNNKTNVRRIIVYTHRVLCLLAVLPLDDII